MTTALYATDTDILDLDDPALDDETDDYCPCVERGDGTACHECHERASYDDYYGEDE